MSNGEVRAARRKYELSQEAVAKELGISRASYNYYEVRHWPLPKPLTPSDAIDAIERLAAERAPKAS